jgi:hypothetical protein
MLVFAGVTSPQRVLSRSLAALSCDGDRTGKPCGRSWRVDARMIATEAAPWLARTLQSVGPALTGNHWTTGQAHLYVVS